MWIALIFLSGMKAYRRIIWTLAKGYSLGIAVGLVASPMGTEWPVAGCVDRAWLSCCFHFCIISCANIPGASLLKFDFLDRNRSFYSLFVVGTLYYLAVWVDKFIFWFVPYTSEAVIGPLRASIIYDLPIFLAYLFILPGMAVFLVTMEADFAEQHERFYRAVREGDTLMHIEYRRDQMVYAAGRASTKFSRCRVDGGAVSAMGQGPVACRWHLSAIHSFVLHRCGRGQCAGAADGDTQRAFLSRRPAGSTDHYRMFFHNQSAVHLCHAASGSGDIRLRLCRLRNVVSAFLGLFILSHKFNRLEYETFMLQN